MSSILDCMSASDHWMRHATIRVPVSVPTRAPVTIASGPGIVERAPELVDTGSEGVWYVHAPRASSDPPALLQAFEFALAGVLGLALHEIIIVVLAPGADEEGS